MAGLLDAIKDGQFRGDVLRGLLDAGNRGGVAGLLGGPVDLAALAMRPFGYKEERPLLGSEWIGQQMQNAGMVSANRNAPAEILSSLALPFAATRLLGAINSNSAAQSGKIGASSASKSPRMNDPKPTQQRPFRDDYPQGASGPDGSKLTFDIDGRPINPEAYVAGRRVVGGVDEGIGPGESRRIAELLGIDVRAVRSSDIGGDAGKYWRGAGPDGESLRTISVANGLDGVQAGHVMRHELGHAIDDAAMYFRGTEKKPVSIPGTGSSRELAQVYSDLNSTMYVPRGKIGATPKSQGYKEVDFESERMAEHLRAYLQDPNYLKTVSPTMAARIREHVNTNPNLNKTIHFNSGAGLLGAYGVSRED